MKNKKRVVRHASLAIALVLAAIGILLLPVMYTTFVRLLLWGYALLFLLLHIGMKKGWRLRARFAAAGLIASAVCIGALEIMMASAADGPVEDPPDYVIVLGAGVWGDRLSPVLQERMATALAFLEAHPETAALLSGGQGSGENLPEAEAMARYLLERGISRERLLLESASSSTGENIAFSLALLSGEGDPQQMQLAVLTSDFHLMRAKMLLDSHGIEAHGIASDTPGVVEADYHVREYLALVKTCLELALGL